MQGGLSRRAAENRAFCDHWSKEGYGDRDGERSRGHSRGEPRAGRGRTLCRSALGRCGGPGDQGRAARGGLRPRLRRLRHGSVGQLRVAQPRQAVDRPRPQEGRGQGAARADPGQGRRLHPEPGTGGHRTARSGLGGAAGPVSPADHLRHLGLRRGRALEAPQGVRSPRPGRERTRLGQRDRRRAGAGGGVDLRHRRRDHRGGGDLPGPLRPRADR